MLFHLLADLDQLSVLALLAVERLPSQGSQVVVEDGTQQLDCLRLQFGLRLFVLLLIASEVAVDDEAFVHVVLYF